MRMNVYMAPEQSKRAKTVIRALREGNLQRRIKSASTEAAIGKKNLNLETGAEKVREKEREKEQEEIPEVLIKISLLTMKNIDY